MEIALKGFLADQSQIEPTCESTEEQDRTIEAGKKAAKTACQYVDWLLSTVNPYHLRTICGINLSSTLARSVIKTY